MIPIHTALATARRIVGRLTALRSSPAGVVRVEKDGIVFSTRDRIVTSEIRCEHALPEGVFPLELLEEAVRRGGQVRFDDGRIRVGRWSVLVDDRTPDLSWEPPGVSLQDWPHALEDLELASMTGPPPSSWTGDSVLISPSGVARITGIAAASRGTFGRYAIPDAALKPVRTLLGREEGTTTGAWTPMTLILSRGNCTVRIIGVSPPVESQIQATRERVGTPVLIDPEVFRDAVRTASRLGTMTWYGDRIHGRKGPVRVMTPAGGVIPLPTTLPSQVAEFVRRDPLEVRFSHRCSVPDRIQLWSGDAVLTLLVRRPDPV